MAKKGMRKCRRTAKISHPIWPSVLLKLVRYINILLLKVDFIVQAVKEHFKLSVLLHNDINTGILKNKNKKVLARVVLLLTT